MIYTKYFVNIIYFWLISLNSLKSVVDSIVNSTDDDTMNYDDGNRGINAVEQI